MREVHDLTAAEQVQALRAREVSSVELTTHYLHRIDRHAGDLGAFATVAHDSAVEAARAADAALARGDAGPLTGLPLGIKDLQATAGMPMTLGSRALQGFVPAEDTWTVGRLRRAGAVILGKTSAAELGATCYDDGAGTGRPSVTPYDAARYASGSSGGAAAAVAAGLLPAAHGSDGAGSIRTPASTTHLVGMKPSRGSVSAAPSTTFLATTIEGTLTRTVEDAALLLDVMAHPAPGDVYGRPPREPLAFTGAVRRGEIRPLRIGTWSESGLEGTTIDPGIVAAVQRAAETLRRAGHDVREIPVPAPLGEEVTEAMRVWLTTAVAFAASTVIPPARHELLTPLTRHLVADAERLSSQRLLGAHAILARYASTHLAAFEHVDVALTPTTSATAVPVGHFLRDGVEGVLERMLRWSSPTPWVNLTGQPAIAMPAGLDAAGLPLSVQLVGRAGADAALLVLARQLESLQRHHGIHPPVWTQ